MSFPAFLCFVLFFTLISAAFQECMHGGMSSSSESMMDNIKWKNIQEITPDFLSTNTMPIMVLIHKSWSGPCRMLMEEMRDSEKSKHVKMLSQNFVMVNVVDSDEPSEEWLSPDGVYYPRILFLNSTGQVQPQFTCSMGMKSKFKYYYSSASQVAHSMKFVLDSSLENIEKNA